MLRTFLLERPRAPPNKRHQRSLKLPRPPHDLPPGGADRSPAGDHCPLIPAGIALSRLPGPVDAAAIGLDDQALFEPDEVRPDHRLAVIEVDPYVDLRQRDAALAAEGKNASSSSLWVGVLPM